MNAEHLRYLELFETLTPDRLEDLTALYTEQAHFKDPFNDVRGRQAIRQIFQHMFETTHKPAFSIRHAGLDHFDRSIRDSGMAEHATTQSDVDALPVNHLLIVWRFDCLTLKDRSIHIEGSSLVTFTNPEKEPGKVVRHLDYWDPVEHLYHNVPLLGKVLHWLGSRLSATDKSLNRENYAHALAGKPGHTQNLKSTVNGQAARTD